MNIYLHILCEFTFGKAENTAPMKPKAAAKHNVLRCAAKYGQALKNGAIFLLFMGKSPNTPWTTTKEATMTERTRRISLRLNDHEYDRVIELCGKSGMSLAAFFRALIWNSRIIEMPPLDYLELSRQLSAIGNMINQITRIANTTGYIHIDALEQHYADVNEILQIVKRGFIESKDELSVHKKPTRRKTSCKR